MTERQSPETTASRRFPLGMKTLHDDPDAVADICFVHGLTGGRRSAWTTHQQSDTWLQTLLPSHLNKVRILSFGYDQYTTATFQTGHSNEYDRNGYLRRHRHQDVTIRRPESQPSDILQISNEILAPSVSPESTSSPASFFISRPCYVLCFLMFLVIGGSASLGIYYSVRYDKMGDGFTAAGRIVAIGTLVLAGPLARHYPHCSCWGTEKPYYAYELRRMGTLPSPEDHLFGTGI
ncbi:hypothetical protein FPOAC2_09880 [Fusarium poae]|jgi:hypothetical protein|uniref:DUF676 domain-containing protein n=1 Tax=Fusarium poae TaxID=36050 RepID=A0A1B8AQF1_FUSPO|nr:hypothetical protein FPOAC1_009939 [Fusarium poae]KAG8670518.1 hypothetical protein FPOAC1_009939 [Fusarium poae]OBS22717.1 hypothetical protein FPOA_09049 [Fusarium poae]